MTSTRLVDFLATVYVKDSLFAALPLLPPCFCSNQTWTESPWFWPVTMALTTW